MKNKSWIIIAMLLLGWGTSSSQILTFDFAGLAGNEATAVSNSNDPNLTGSTISRGSGLTASANGDRFNATDWALTSIANAVSGDDYMEFTITPSSGYQFSVSSIFVQLQRSSTGPRGIAIRNSLDGFATNLDQEYAIADNTSTQTFTFTFSQSNSSTPVTYRIYKWAEATGGSGGIGDGGGNDLIIYGTVSSACTPPTTQASNFGTANIETDQMDVSWTGGDGDGVIVVAREGAAVATDPMNGETYTANAAFGTSGTELEDGFIVYIGDLETVTVTNLDPATTYHFAIYEYFNDPGDECYLTPGLADNETTASLPPNITHTGTSPAAVDILQGSTNNVLYQVQVEVADGPATLTQVVAATGGTFDGDDLDNFKLWFSTDASFNSASDVLLATINDPSTGDQTFSVSNQVFPVGTRYLFITCDVDAAGTLGHSVSCAPDADGDFTYTEDETYSGSSFAAANLMTIIGTPELQLEYPISTNMSCGGTIPFGDVAINGTSDLTFRIRNTGSADLTFSALSIGGANADQYSIQTQPTSPITPGNFSDAVVRFAPTTTGAKTAAITITSNDADESSCVVNLTGTGRPVNDECSGAITLTVETGETCNSPLSTSSTGASQSIAAIPCNAFTGDADDDVWFQFVATGTSHIITVDGASNMDAVVDLREGGCNGTNIACADATGGDGIEVITATGLTIGATYLVRVYDYAVGSGDFTICVTTPVPPLHYRTVQSGNFSNANTWETSPDNNAPWTAALQAPDINDLSITIMSGDDVTISSGATLDQLTIASGSSLNVAGGTFTVADGSGDDLVIEGTLINQSTILTSGIIIVKSGGKYQHQMSGSPGTIPSSTWEAGSICEVISTNNGRPNGLGQNFHHFWWNYSTQTSEVNLNGELDNIVGDFHILSTGTSNLRMIGSGNTTIVGGDMIIDAGAILNLSGTTQNEIIQLTGNCTINGTLTELGSGNNNRIEFVGTGNGMINVGVAGLISNTVNLVINRSGSGDVTLGTDVTLPIESVITLTDGLLNTGAFKLVLLNTEPTSISGGSSASYINGNLRQYIGFETYTFPLGDMNTFAPVSLGIINSGATWIDAMYDGDNPGISSGSSTCNNPAEEYTYTSNCGSWVLTPNQTGTEQYNLTLVDAENCGLVTYTIAKNTVFDDCPSGLSKEFTSWSRFDLLGGPAGSPLPVELTRFDAMLNGQQVDLTWATASEINNDYFLVQHSTDGARFEELDMVPGAGTTTLPQNYSWTHGSPSAGVNYYRLRQVDYDGQFEYSPIRVVDLRGDARGPQWAIRPTVTSDVLYLIRQGEGTGTAVWTVMTPAGRMAFSGTIAEGAEHAPVAVQSLPSGMYILRVSSREGVWSGRFWKE